MRISFLGIRGIPARYGGFETCVDHTSRLMAAAGHQVTVYNRGHRPTDLSEWYEGVRLKNVPQPRTAALHTIGHTLRCAWAMRHEPIEIVHIYGVGNALAIPALRRRGRGIVISVDAQDWARAKWGPVARQLLRLSARFAVRSADRIVVDSRTVADYYRQRLGATPCYIAYGAELVPASGTKWLTRLGLQSGRYHLFVGRLTPEKQPHHLIAAYRQVRSDLPLVIVGDDPYNDSYIKRLKATADSRVRFIGPVYGDGFHQLCYHSYLYLTASAVEGTSPALLQAMAQGAAVLVNGIPANRETIGDAGRAYQENDVADLARQWQALIDRPEHVTALRTAARKRVRSCFTWSRVTDQLLSLYESVLVGPPGDSPTGICR